jgi:hypothetical protein
MKISGKEFNLTFYHKAVIFAPYFGQKVYRNVLWSDNLPTSELNENCLNVEDTLKNGYLELTHYQKISDEHALEVSRILGGASHLSKESQIAQLKDLLSSPNFYNKQTNVSASSWLKAFQYMQGVGYALPNGEYSVEDQVELNIIKLK